MPSQGKAINLQTTTGRQVPACWHLWCKELNLFLIVLTQVANPYVSKSHRVAVVLELDGPFGCVRLLVVANTSVPSRAWIFLFVVQKYTVMDNGDTGLLGYFSVHPPRGLKNNVIGLPRPGDLAGIGQRWQMTIHRTRLPIGVLSPEGGGAA